MQLYQKKLANVSKGTFLRLLMLHVAKMYRYETWTFDCISLPPQTYSSKIVKQLNHQIRTLPRNGRFSVYIKN